MNHKYSTYTLVSLFFLLLIGFTFSLDSSDLDELCNLNNHTLMRINGTWICASLNNTLITQVTNNITNVFNNYSLFANSSDLWDDWDTDSEMLNANRTGGDVYFSGDVAIGAVNPQSVLDVTGASGTPSLSASNGFVEFNPSKYVSVLAHLYLLYFQL